MPRYIFLEDYIGLLIQNHLLISVPVWNVWWWVILLLLAYNSQNAHLYLDEICLQRAIVNLLSQRLRVSPVSLIGSWPQVNSLGRLTRLLSSRRLLTLFALGSERRLRASYYHQPKCFSLTDIKFLVKECFSKGWSAKYHIDNQQIRSPLLGACNFHSKPGNTTAFLQNSEFLDIFFRRNRPVRVYMRALR